MKHKNAGFCFYEDTESNDWYGIYTLDEADVSTEVLQDTLRTIQRELTKRGCKL